MLCKLRYRLTTSPPRHNIDTKSSASHIHRFTKCYWPVHRHIFGVLLQRGESDGGGAEILRGCVRSAYDVDKNRFGEYMPMMR